MRRILPYPVLAGLELNSAAACIEEEAVPPINQIGNYHTQPCIMLAK